MLTYSLCSYMIYISCCKICLKFWIPTNRVHLNVLTSDMKHKKFYKKQLSEIDISMHVFFWSKTVVGTWCCVMWHYTASLWTLIWNSILKSLHYHYMTFLFLEQLKLLISSTLCDFVICLQIETMTEIELRVEKINLVLPQ